MYNLYNHIIIYLGLSFYVKIEYNLYMYKSIYNIYYYSILDTTLTQYTIK